MSFGRWYIGLSGNNVLYFFWRCLEKSLQAHSQLSLLSRQALPWEGSLRRAQPWRNPLSSRGLKQDHSLQHIFLSLTCSTCFCISFSHFRGEAPLPPLLSAVSSSLLLYSRFLWKGKWDLGAFHTNLPFCVVFCARSPLSPAPRPSMKSAVDV